MHIIQWQMLKYLTKMNLMTRFLSIYLSIYLSLSISIYLSIYLNPPKPAGPSLSVSLSIIRSDIFSTWVKPFFSTSLSITLSCTFLLNYPFPYFTQSPRLLNFLLLRMATPQVPFYLGPCFSLFWPLACHLTTLTSSGWMLGVKMAWPG